MMLSKKKNQLLCKSYIATYKHVPASLKKYSSEKEMINWSGFQMLHPSPAERSLDAGQAHWGGWRGVKHRVVLKLPV